MDRLNHLCVALLLAFARFFPMGAGVFDCSSECFMPYSDFSVVDSCDTVNQVLDCYYSYQEACDADGLFFYVGLAMDDQNYLGCLITPITATPPILTDPDEPCPTVSDETIPAVISMSSAVVLPESRPPECTMPRVDRLRQCSLFMDSQLRAFNSYRGGLETCSLPGSWYLFHHQSLTIEVEGTNFENGSNHTRLTKVNVTFNTHECNPSSKTYTAVNLEPLPLEFTPPQPDAGNSTSSVQILFGTDGSVVTLLDTRLNATIVIRKYMEFLSVTLQVPREMSLESEGLCTGCPGHMYINITSFNNLYPSLCPEVNTRVLEDCFDHGGVVNEFRLLDIQNNSYYDACVYSLFKIGRKLDVLTMYNAIADDAMLLVNIGAEPRPKPSLPTDLPSLSSSSSTSSTTTQSTAITDSTGELSASSSQHHSSKLVPLTLLTILYGILVPR